MNRRLTLILISMFCVTKGCSPSQEAATCRAVLILILLGLYFIFDIVLGAWFTPQVWSSITSFGPYDTAVIADFKRLCCRVMVSVERSM